MLILLNWLVKLLERDPFHFCVRRVDGHLLFLCFLWHGTMPLAQVLLAWPLFTVACSYVSYRLEAIVVLAHGGLFGLQFWRIIFEQQLSRIRLWYLER